MLRKLVPALYEEGDFEIEDIEENNKMKMDKKKNSNSIKRNLNKFITYVTILFNHHSNKDR